MRLVEANRTWVLVVAAGAGLGLSMGVPAGASPKPPAGIIENQVEPKAVSADPVTAAISEYEAKVKKAVDEKAKLGEVLPKFADEAMAGLDVARLKSDELQSLQRSGILRYTTQLDGIRARAADLAKDPGPDGLKAAILGLSMLDREEGKAQTNNAAISAALNHPALPGALKDGPAPDFYNAVQSIPGESMKEAAPSLLRLSASLPDELPVDVAPRVVGIMTAMLEEKAGTTRDQREPMRLKFLKIVANAEAKAAAAGTDEKAERAKKSLARAKAYLSGAFARGALVNNPAPELDITWWSAEPKISSLSELKGKVVVLDFWATWCGPCVASFPKVKELAAYYEGFPVEIIGVTSIQGYHIGDDHKKIDCKDDPAKEMGLMPEYIKQKDITWKVGFAKQDVFNPEYGVRGIPHVAIIDTKGVVRFRGLHPMDPMEHKIEMIDGLLKEAGLPTPSREKAGG